MRAKVSKVLLALLTAICVACFAYAGPGVYAEGEEPEEIIAEKPSDFDIQLNDETEEYYISGLKKEDATMIIIPSEVRGLPVTKINANAFVSKINVKKVVIPDSITYIGNNAFYNCNQLTDLTMPCDVDITSNCFDYCYSLKKITFSYGKTGIMTDADDSNDGNGLYYGFAPQYRTGNLEEVVFDDKITYIGDRALVFREKVAKVDMPDNEVTVGDYAFYRCRALKDIDTSKITKYGISAFEDCNTLPSITINEKVDYIPERCFINCIALTDLEIPDTVTKIGANAFYNCNAIINLTIPCDIDITSNCFDYCYSVKKINYTYGKTGVMTDADDSNDGNGLYYVFTPQYRTGVLEEVVFDDKITHIGDRALANREKVTKIDMPDNEVTVGDYAFYRCRALTDFDTSKIIEYGISAFEDCNTLPSITINEKIKKIPDRCFLSCVALTELVIPDNVKEIGTHAFYNCNQVGTVSIPCDVTAYNSFEYCSNVKNIKYTYGSTGKMTDGDESNDGAGQYWPFTLAGRNGYLENVEFEDGITHIGDFAFRGRNQLANVDFPNNTFTVGTNAFYDCRVLVIEDVDKITDLGSYAFYNCQLLKNININNEVTRIPEGTFRNCIGVSVLSIPDSVISIEGVAFYDCSNITEITLPIDVNYTDNSFNNYGYCKKVTYTKGETGDYEKSQNHNSGQSLQNKISACENIYFGDGVKKITNGMFNYNISKNINNFVFPKTIETVANNAFINGLNAYFYGYKDTQIEKFAENDDTITFRPLNYPQIDTKVDETEIGKEEQFKAFVYTDIDTTSEEIEWSVKDANSKKTVIDNTGKLTVGSNEKSAEIKVCATYGENTVEVPVKINRSVFIVEFDAGEGTSDEEAMACNADGMLEVLPRARYDYFTFVGWFTAKDGGEKIDINTVFTEDTVVYAHYSLTPVDTVEIKAGAKPKSGDTFDTTVGKVSDNIDAASVKVSYALDGKEVTGEAKCLKTYTINVSFKLKNGFTITDASKVSVNGGNVKATEAEGVYTVSSTFAATTHGEAVLKYAKEATKTEEGYTGDKCCSICNEVLEKGKTIAKLPADSTDPTNPTNPENPDDGYVDASTLKIGMIKSGLLVADKKSCAKYKITKVTKKKGKISGGNVTFMMQSNKNAKSVTVKDTVVLAGVKFKLTEINAKAFDGCAKLTKVTIGKNVTKIGANAFNGDAKLKNVIFKGTKVKKMGKNAYKGTYKKIKFKAPKKVVKKYKKLIKKAGAPKKFKITKK